LIALLTGHDEAVGAWIGNKLGQTIVPPFAAVGVLKDGHLAGGWVLNGFNSFNGDLTIFAPGVLTRRTIGACYAHLFIDHGLIRVTGRTRRDNATMRALFPRLGFQMESVARRYYGPHRKDDAFVFVLFARDAQKWISPMTARS
jgi:hypothetical protein